MNILVFSNFSKRKNSTKTPLDSSGTVVDVALKESTSIEAPVFRLTSNDFTINYVKAFGAYYFVSDIVSIDKAHIEIYCEKDVLATYKSEIGATDAFVVYATNGNAQIIDPRICCDAALDLSTVKTAAMPWAVNSSGTVRLTVNGMDGCVTYSLSIMGMRALLSDLQTWSDDLFNQHTPPSVQGDTIQQIKESFQWMGTEVCGFLKQLVSSGNVGDNIRSAVWVPWDVDGVAMGSGENIYLGQYDTGFHSAWRISQVIDSQDVAIEIPWLYGDWRDAVFSQLYIYIPYIGVINIDTRNIIGIPYIRLQMARNTQTGALSVKIGVGSSGVTAIEIGTYGADTAAPYPVGMLIKDPSGILNTVVSVGAGVVSGGVGAAIGAAGTIRSIANAIIPNPTVIGGIGGGAGAGLDQSIKVWMVGRTASEAPGASAAAHGMPLMAKRTIGNLSGYVQCENASADITGESRDKDAVNGFLNGGFYYE